MVETAINLLVFVLISVVVLFGGEKIIDQIEKNWDKKWKLGGVCFNYSILLLYILLYSAGFFSSLLIWGVLFFFVWLNYHFSSDWRWFLFFQLNMLVATVLGEIISAQLYLRYILDSLSAVVSILIVLMLSVLFGLVKVISEYKKSREE